MIRASASQFLRRVAHAPRVTGPRVGIPSGHLQLLPNAAAAGMARGFHFSARREDDSPKSIPNADSAVAVKKGESEEPEKTGFWEPIYALPIAIAFAVPALHLEWIIINEETFVISSFIAFVVVTWKQAGGFIEDFLSADGKKILYEQNKVEDAIIHILQSEINDIKFQWNVIKDTEDVNALKVQTVEKLNAAGKIKPMYDFKAQVERMLSLVEAEELNMKEKKKVALMAEATAAVTQRFATSPELKKSSLENAIAALKGTTDGKAKDDVKAAYIAFFKEKQKAAQNVDAEAEQQAARKVIVTKLKALAQNEGFFFDFDAAGKPKMVV